MTTIDPARWKHHTVTPDQALARIEPGMSIFIGTGVAEPLTMVKSLMASSAANLQDLVLTQIVSFGDAISVRELQSHKYRLRTFFSGWVASEAIATGRVELIPPVSPGFPNSSSPARSPLTWPSCRSRRPTRRAIAAWGWR